MILEELLQSDSVLCNAPARSKKHSLEILSELLARPNPAISNEEIFAGLIERERLGCTGLDDGMAFPHCRVTGASSSAAAVMKLSSPVEFDAADGEKVDLIFGLMVPSDLNESHHAEIRRLARMLKDDTLRERMRAATSSNELYAAILATEQSQESQLRGALRA